MRLPVFLSRHPCLMNRPECFLLEQGQTWEPTVEELITKSGWVPEDLDRAGNEPVRSFHQSFRIPMRNMFFFHMTAGSPMMWLPMVSRIRSLCRVQMSSIRFAFFFICVILALQVEMSGVIHYMISIGKRTFVRVAPCCSGICITKIMDSILQGVCV